MRTLLVPMLLAWAVAAPAGPIPADARLTMQGLGTLKIGLSKAVVGQLGLVIDEAYPPDGDPDASSCQYVRIKGHPGIGPMFEKGRLTRIDIDKDARNVRTDAGIGIGSTEREALRAYGKRMQAVPNFYDADEHDLQVFSADGRYGFVFETTAGNITSFRAGLRASVLYVEGCE